jgi:hypothetical protein
MTRMEKNLGNKKTYHIKNYINFVNEELRIGNIEHDFKHKFKAGDICKFKDGAISRGLNGELCKILYRSKKEGKSIFQGISNFFRYDYCPEIKFASPKTNTYSVKFLDVYDSVVRGAPGDLDSWTRTDTLKILNGVPEYNLELDPISTKNYKEELEKNKIKNLSFDPYGEEEWDDDHKGKNFKLDKLSKEWIEI